jgi:hypothetical protein
MLPPPKILMRSSTLMYIRCDEGAHIDLQSSSPKTCTLTYKSAKHKAKLPLPNISAEQTCPDLRGEIAPSPRRLPPSTKAARRGKLSLVSTQTHGLQDFVVIPGPASFAEKSAHAAHMSSTPGTAELDVPEPPAAQQPCYLCMDRRPVAVLVECGHGGLCAACAMALWCRSAAAPKERRCPLCRQPFVGVMIIVSEAHGKVRPAPILNLYPT